MSFPPFILPRSTINKCVLTTAVQSVVELCNIAVYLHSQSTSNTNIGYYTGSRSVRLDVFTSLSILKNQTRKNIQWY